MGLLRFVIIVGLWYILCEETAEGIGTMNGKTKIQFKDKLWLHVAGIVMLLLLAIVLLWHNNAHSMQATSAIAAQVRFVGEYRIGDGSWREIT